jgi:phosphoglycerol transferase MdoB-like AlkP superfamily enzyme
MEAILIFAIVCVLVFYILHNMQMDPAARQVITIIVGIVLLLVLFGYVGYGPGIHWRG